MDKSMADIDRQVCRLKNRLYRKMDLHDPSSVYMTKQRASEVNHIGMVMKMNLRSSANVVLPHVEGIHVEDVYHKKYDIKARRR